MNPIVNRSSTETSERYLAFALLGTENLFHSPVRGLSAILSNVQRIESEGVTIAVRSIPEAIHFGEVSAGQLNEFSEVVKELHRLGDILPFRFGTLLSKDELFEILLRQGDHHRECLQKVAGCSEVNIRWAIPNLRLKAEEIGNPLQSQQPFSGSDYLRAKHRSKSRTYDLESLLSKISQELKRLFQTACRDARVSVGSMHTKSPDTNSDTEYSIARIDLLVRRESIDQVLKAAARIPIQFLLPTVVSGPWPPYSFLEPSLDAVPEEHKVADCPSQAPVLLA